MTLEDLIEDPLQICRLYPIGTKFDQHSEPILTKRQKQDICDFGIGHDDVPDECKTPDFEESEDPIAGPGTRAFRGTAVGDED